MAVSDTGKRSRLRQQDDEHCYNVTQQLTKISNRYSSMCRPSVNLLRVLGTIRAYENALGIISSAQFWLLLHVSLTKYAYLATLITLNECLVPLVPRVPRIP